MGGRKTAEMRGLEVATIYILGGTENGWAWEWALTQEMQKNRLRVVRADMLKNREKRGEWVPNGLAPKLLDAGRTRLGSSSWGRVLSSDARGGWEDYDVHRFACHTRACPL